MFFPRLEELDVSSDVVDLRAAVADFVSREVIPVERQLPPEAREIPRDALARIRKEAKRVGYWMWQTPARFGGGGLSCFDAAVIGEEAAKHKFSFGSYVFGQEPPAVLLSASLEQQERYLKPTVEHGWQSFTAISEPTGGSDPARAITTTAQRDGDGYVLNGRKLWTTNVDGARYGVVFARTDKAKGRKGISAFIVDADTPGMSFSPVPVIRDHWTNEVLFDDCRIPAANRIGAEGEGFDLTRGWTQRGRLFNAAFAVGVADKALELAAAAVRDRETFGAPLATRQGVQFMLADAAVELHAARLMLRYAAKMCDESKKNTVSVVSAAKYYCTEKGFRIVDQAMQLFGAMGMTKDLPLEHWFRDLRVSRIVEGPTEIHKYVVARELLGQVATWKPQPPV